MFKNLHYAKFMKWMYFGKNNIITMFNCSINDNGYNYFFPIHFNNNLNYFYLYMQTL